MSTDTYPRYLPFGDSALLVEFGDKISIDTNRRVIALGETVQKAQVKGVEELVPTYRSLLIRYNPLNTPYEHLVFEIKNLENTSKKPTKEERRRILNIPVAYGGTFGPDLTDVAKLHSLTEKQVINFHIMNEYRVYMIGFIAGFPYLGEVPDQIATPRLKTPRLKVPAGSVGIAEKQTGIYPHEAPGGWRIIGRTPITIFSPSATPPAFLVPGDTVRFEPVSGKRFKTLKEAVAKDKPMPNLEEK